MRCPDHLAADWARLNVALQELASKGSDPDGHVDRKDMDAAVSGVAQSQRDDVAAELRTSVADAVDDLTAQGLTEAAEVPR